MTVPQDSVYRPVVADERDVDALPVVTKATDYPAGHSVELHHHARGQLIYAEHGVMMVALVTTGSASTTRSSATTGR